MLLVRAHAPRAMLMRARTESAMRECRRAMSSEHDAQRGPRFTNISRTRAASASRRRRNIRRCVVVYATLLAPPRCAATIFMRVAHTLYGAILLNEGARKMLPRAAAVCDTALMPLIPTKVRIIDVAQCERYGAPLRQRLLRARCLDERKRASAACDARSLPLCHATLAIFMLIIFTLLRHLSYGARLMPC